MDIFNLLIEGEQSRLDSIQMIIRSFIVYICAIILIRIGNKRLIGKNTAFDFLFSVIIGSIISRAITGNAPLVPSIVVSAFLILFHYVLSYIAYKTEFFGKYIKGSPRELICDGKMNKDEMAKSNITENDLMMELRLQGNTTEFSSVKKAYLERNGEISIIKKENSYEIIDIDMEEGVKTVRIKIK